EYRAAVCPYAAPDRRRSLTRPNSPELRSCAASTARCRALRASPRARGWRPRRRPARGNRARSAGSAFRCRVTRLRACDRRRDKQLSAATSQQRRTPGTVNLAADSSQFCIVKRRRGRKTILVSNSAPGSTLYSQCLDENELERLGFG